jgi:hypothetical protein
VKRVLKCMTKNIVNRNESAQSNELDVYGVLWVAKFSSVVGALLAVLVIILVLRSCTPS